MKFQTFQEYLDTPLTSSEEVDFVDDLFQRLGELERERDEMRAQVERLQRIAVVANDMFCASGPREEVRAERKLRSLVDAAMPDLLEPAASLAAHDAAVRAQVWREAAKVVEPYDDIGGAYNECLERAAAERGEVQS